MAFAWFRVSGHSFVYYKIKMSTLEEMKKKFEEMKEKGAKQLEEIKALMSSTNSTKPQTEPETTPSSKTDSPSTQKHNENSSEKKSEKKSEDTPEHKEDHKSEQKSEHKEEHKSEQKSEHKEDHKSEHKEPTKDKNEPDQTFGSKQINSDPVTSTYNQQHQPSLPTLGSSNTPVSIQLESEALQKHHDRLPFRSYLENGYKKYKTWLSMTLGSTFSQHLNFCIARSLNQSKQNAMGIDLEIRYLLKRLENLFGKSEMKYYENSIRNTLKENLDLSDIHIQTTIDSYFRNPMAFELTLSDQEFSERLKNVPTYDLDRHSFLCWRNSNHKELNKTPYPVTAEDILNGESLSPPSSTHLGLQMLQISGYMPVLINPKQARPFGVTFI